MANLHARTFMHARTIALCAAALALAPAAARAEPHVLRLATAAPDGTAWAREFKAFARELAARTHGEVQLKWYFGSIAGDELQVGERIRRGQLDGVASGGMLCERVAPSIRAIHMTGVYPDRAAAGYVAMRLMPDFQAEAQQNGFTIIGAPIMGVTMLFSRTPLRSLDEMRRVNIWRWDLDDVGQMMTREMGMHLVTLPLVEAAHAYDTGRVEGFLSIPTGALAFQWSAQAHYMTNLPFDYLLGCMMVASRAIDELPVEGQRELRAAASKMAERIAVTAQEQEEALVRGLFARQGLEVVVPNEAMRAEVMLEASRARERLGDRLVPRALFARVQALLDEWRAERAGAAAGGAR
jgi:TRAP-type C4-dicarboxylate transport system substrate-binding protein